MSISIEVFFLIVVLCQVYTRHVGNNKYMDDRAITKGDVSRFDACRYPVDGGVSATSLATEIISYNNVTFVGEMPTITRWEIDNINSLMKSVSTGRCGILDSGNLDDILTIRTNPTTRNLDRITQSYFEISKQVHLMKYMEIKLAPIAEDCCLTYPSELSERLTNRLLKKWYILQNRCGDNIEREHCDVTFDIILKEPVRCHRTADILQFLLKSTRRTLRDSLSVLHLLREKMLGNLECRGNVNLF